MSTFHLPDLGEGLPDAEIHEWHVKVGDEVSTDDPLVSMETAKAVVDVPAPQSGKIRRLHGQPGDIIKTGAPLVEFESEEKPADAGTVVGNIETSDDTLEENVTIGSVKRQAGSTVRATPAVRALARKLSVDLNSISGTGTHGVITASDVESASSSGQDLGEMEALRGVRRTMAITMTKANAEVVPVTIFDDADIHAWPEGTDITVRLIQALVHACKEEPALNAWYDGRKMARRCHDEVHLGIAMDTGEALFVPVIQSAQNEDAASLRAKVNNYKTGVRNRDIPAENLQGATITLSNFGNFAGRYASPIIVPPTVAILGVGRLREEAVVLDGQVAAHKSIPLSLSFDHRAATGGEATRFLGAVMAHLSKATV